MSSLIDVRVAILDDHRLFRQGIRYILQSLPFVGVVTEAGTFAELLPQFAQRLPDVLLLDLEMPGTDGMEAAKHLLDTYPDLKIVVLSMHSDDHFIEHMFKLGVRSYLPKDVDKEQLRAAIETVMTQGHYFTDHVSKAMMRSLQTPTPRKPSFHATTLVLTQREKEVLALLCEGYSTNDIAEQLFLSGRTVEGHRRSLLEKTDTPNAVSLVRYAVEHGLVVSNGRKKTL